MGQRLWKGCRLAVVLVALVACAPDRPADAPPAAPARSDAHLGPPASDDWPTLPAEGAAYIQERLEGDMLAQIAPDPRPYGLRKPYGEISFGRPVPRYGLTVKFFDGEAGDQRRLAFRESGTWLIPVLQNGVPRTVVHIGPLHDDRLRFTGIGGSAKMAEALARLRPGDLLFYDGPKDAEFVVRGTVVSELDVGAGRRVLRGPVSLSRFHEKLLAAYRAEVPVGPDSTN